MTGVVCRYSASSENTLHADKIETYSLDRKPLLPHFPIPDDFSDAGEYLRHLTYEGGKGVMRNHHAGNQKKDGF